MNDFIVTPELGNDYSLVEKFIPNNSKLLFLKPRTLEIVRWFQESKDCICTVFDSDTDKLAKCLDYNIETVYGNINHDLISIKNNTYQYVISEPDIISKIKTPLYLIYNGCRISANNFVLNFKNFSYLKNRINFFFTGTQYGGLKFQHEDKKTFWNEQSPWRLGYKDIRNMIDDLELALVKGFYLDAKKRLENIFDIKCNPNMFGIDFTLFISKDINLIKNYSINTNILIG